MTAAVEVSAMGTAKVDYAMARVQLLPLLPPLHRKMSYSLSES
jgi:hypothetical protein